GPSVGDVRRTRARTDARRVPQSRFYTGSNATPRIAPRALLARSRGILAPGPSFSSRWRSSQGTEDSAGRQRLANGGRDPKPESRPTADAFRFPVSNPLRN